MCVYRFLDKLLESREREFVIRREELALKKEELDVRRAEATHGISLINAHVKHMEKVVEMLADVVNQKKEKIHSDCTFEPTGDVVNSKKRKIQTE